MYVLKNEREWQSNNVVRFALALAEVALGTRCVKKVLWGGCLSRHPAYNFQALRKSKVKRVIA